MPDLSASLAAAGVLLPPDILDALNQYHALLLDWNTQMDLTSVSEADMAQRHFVDSLLPLARTDLLPDSLSLIDVGTGAGFPGLALAIARPQWRVTLLEAQGKRCQFLRAVLEALGLKNTTVIQERAEVLGRDPLHRERYDRAVARAVAPLNVLCEYLLPFVGEGGYALCWKGPAVTEEWADGEAAAALLGGELEPAVTMAFEGAAHVICPIRKMRATLPQYPRKNGIPAKRPLKNDKKG